MVDNSPSDWELPSTTLNIIVIIPVLPDRTDGVLPAVVCSLIRTPFAQCTITYYEQTAIITHIGMLTRYLPTFIQIVDVLYLHFQDQRFEWNKLASSYVKRVVFVGMRETDFDKDHSLTLLQQRKYYISAS